MGSHRKIALLTLVVLVACAWPASPVAAAPIEKQRDRSDNTMYFEWEAATGEMPSAFSSRLFNRGDRVDFVVYARERKVEDAEKRLTARIGLRLNRDRPVAYDGVFWVIVQDDLGNTVFKGSRDTDFVLRPRDGFRSRFFRWRFDLDVSGNYTIFARFEAA